jgi:hypothetical protein
MQKDKEKRCRGRTGLVKKMIAVLLALTIVFATMLTVSADPAGDSKITIPSANPNDRPTIRIIGNNVLDEEEADSGFFELILSVETAENNTFKAVGVALQYDPAVITPVTWGLTAEEEIVPDIPLGSDRWRTQIPTQSSDLVSTAAALTNSDGLLYLWAESATPTVLRKVVSDGENQISTGVEILAVRFAFVNDKTSADITADTFRSAEFAPGDVAALATDANAASSPAGQTVWYNGGDTEYYYTTRPGSTAGIVVDAVGGDTTTNLLDAPGFSTRSGPSYLISGGAGMTLDDVSVIVFYDWDETLLGVVPISKQVSEDVLKQRIDAFVANNYHDYNPAFDPSLVQGTPVDPHTVKDAYPERALTGKKGYNFAGWVQTSPETLESDFTAYATTAAYDSAAFAVEKPEDGWGMVYLKAGYVGNDELDKYGVNAVAATRKNYTYTDFSYNRIDASNNGMYFTVLRRNADNAGVTRLQELALRVAYSMGGTSFSISVALESVDEQRVEFVVPTAATSLTITVVDVFGKTSFTQGIAMSVTGVFFSDKPSTNVSNSGNGIANEGSAYYVSDLARQNIDNIIAKNAILVTWTGVTASPMDAMGFTADVLADIVGTGTPAAANATNIRNVAKTRILLYQAAVGNRILTHSEVTAAISLDTGMTLANTITVGYLAPRVKTMVRAYELNGGELNTTQMLAVIAAMQSISITSPYNPLPDATIQGCL